MSLLLLLDEVEVGGPTQITIAADTAISTWTLDAVTVLQDQLIAVLEAAIATWVIPNALVTLGTPGAGGDTQVIRMGHLTNFKGSSIGGF